MSESIIDVSHVSKRFRQQTVLQDVNVSILSGKITGIIGRNGSGKTVLLKCIIGLMPPDSGQISVNGRVIGKDVDFAQDIGFIVDAPGFLPNCSARRNLRYLAAIRGVADHDAIDLAIETVGLNPSDNKYVGKYSMGMTQRLALAQALMESPKILILDEPMNGLDNRGVEEMRKLLLSLRDKGKTILLTSHNHEDIEQLCETVYEMDEGKLIKAAKSVPA